MLRRKTYFGHRLRQALGTTVLVLLACKGTPSSPGIDCNPVYYATTHWIACHDPEEHEFCVQKFACDARTPAEVCAWNIDGDESLSPNYDEAEDYGNCAGDEINFNEGSWPKSACGGDDDPPPVPTTSAGGGESGTSTSGGTSGGSGDTGGTEDPLWICSQRMLDKCANIAPDDALGGDPYPGVDGTDPLRDVCWSKVNPISPDDGGKRWSRCTRAPNVGDAITKCEQDCNSFVDDLNTMLCPNAGCTVENPPVDCLLDGGAMGLDQQELPALFSEHSTLWDCPEDQQFMKVWGGSSQPVNFAANAAVVFDGGITGGVSNIGGYLAYELSNCSLTQCDIAIDVLEGVTLNASGFFTDASGATSEWSVNGLSFRSVDVLHGTWVKSRGNVSFTTDTLVAEVWGDGATIDGFQTWVGHHTFEVEQIVGSLGTETGPLTLNFAFNSPLGTATASLTTVSN